MEAARGGCAASVRELVLSPRIDFTCTNEAGRSITWFLMNGTPSGEAANANQHLSTVETFLYLDYEHLLVNEVDIEGVTPLLLAASSGAHLHVRRLIELQAEYRYQGPSGHSAFHIAALAASPKTLNELLEASKPEGLFDSIDHATPLSFASGYFISGNVGFWGEQFGLDDAKMRELKSQDLRCQVIGMLVNRGANVNTVTLSQGRTPLMFAAHLGYDQVVGLLLDCGAAVDMRDKGYSTALSLAVENGHFAMVRTLLEANATFDTRDKTGASLVIIAAGNGHLPLLRLFLESYKMSVNDRDRNGCTALSYAASFGRENIVHYLLEEVLGVEVEALDRQDQTAFVLACKGGHCLIMDLLDHHGADSRRKDKNGRTPFSYAAGNGRADALRLLLAGKVEKEVLDKLELKDNAGRTALSWAAEEGHLEVARLLLKWGADSLSSDERKQIPRMFALDKGHTKVAKVLATHNPSPNEGDQLLSTEQPSLLDTEIEPSTDVSTLQPETH